MLEEMENSFRQDVFCRMAAKVIVDTIYCTVYQNGKAAACASAAVEQGYALMQNVIVHSTLRGKGLGEKLCRAVLEKARRQGARYAYLQVVQTNKAAMNLYSKLGFRKVYTYWYMKQPAG